MLSDVDKEIITTLLRIVRGVVITAVNESPREAVNVAASYLNECDPEPLDDLELRDALREWWRKSRE